MTILSVNHGAKGSIAWFWPEPVALISTTSALARALTGPCAEYILGGNRIIGVAVSVNGSVDVAAWKSGNKLLVSVVNTRRQATGEVMITVPNDLQLGIVEAPFFGDGGWQGTSSSSGKLVKRGMKGLEADMFVVGLRAELTLPSSLFQKAGSTE